MTNGRRTPPRTPSAKSRTPGSEGSRPSSQTGSRNRQGSISNAGRRLSSAGQRVIKDLKGGQNKTWDTRNIFSAKNAISTVGFYEKVKLVLAKKSDERLLHELNALESWFRKKSNLFAKLKRDILLDVMKHCDFKTYDKDTVIIQQGFKGDHFYIILRGTVSVLVKEEKYDDDEEEENEENILEDFLEQKMETDRTKLGTQVNTISDGGTFGELALMSDDVNRTASIVTDDVADIIIISRDLYNRSVGKLIREDYAAKLRFIESNKLFRDWANKWKKQLAVSLQRKKLSYDEVLLKQGNSSDHIYFIVKGELKLLADPDMHNEHFEDFMKKMSSHFEEDIYKNSMNFRLQNYISPRSRQAKRLKSAAEEAKADGTVQSLQLPENKLIMSPSAMRKKTARTRLTMHRKYNVCYLESGQLVGDVEFFSGLEQYHATAVSTSQETVVYELHYIQFNRYFRKKNPDTLVEMTRSLGVQMPRRIVLEHINKNVPLLRCVMLKIDELNGTNFIKRKQRDEDDAHSEAEIDSTARSRAKSGLSTRSFPMSSKQAANQKDRFKDIGFQLPEMSEQAMAKYLNTQVTQVLQLDKTDDENDENDENDEPGEKEPKKGEGGVYNMAKVERPKKEKKEKRVLNPRDGIFFKVLQVSNPNIEKQHLAIEEDEFNYLCQIKRRITKDLHKYYPFASLESFLSLGDQETKTGRLCRRSVHTAGVEDSKVLKKRKLPHLGKPMKPSMKSREVKSAAQIGRKNVGFALP